MSHSGSHLYVAICLALALGLKSAAAVSVIDEAGKLSSLQQTEDFLGQQPWLPWLPTVQEGTVGQELAAPPSSPPQVTEVKGSGFSVEKEIRQVSVAVQQAGELTEQDKDGPKFPMPRRSPTFPSPAKARTVIKKREGQVCYSPAVYGLDLFNNMDYAACETACRSDPDCTSFAFNLDGNSKSECREFDKQCFLYQKDVDGAPCRLGDNPCFNFNVMSD
mmetsp:Transcript_30454/g.55214  ORF Transcript_30454/g.55214 Transcript_30454/m.55214 type:complete len:219 (+) Transcript_30454:153-809(+)|eukprot:CAMPEP_0197625476 /NCGR_PEP_ID=MMETSP1338-20131121/4834_1 /TAXON_ID=43686 ORGANISM="Pelagodinium beii, Strain RCC1491" /NCGR_SAMPLE_ID=MMETSP1338 /ASSEMBLY_ACC=CAM_ASM_000754 /LENGTH=218 /DNA_ID=CAMNT_0043195901 /DNA_START=153 /DNA_END=809 /DNA_ORIENTATION=-